MAERARPGPMAANMHTDYADRKNGRKPVQYDHEDLEEILGPTFGLMIYQEQLMQIAREMGGFSNFAISFSIISILTGAVTLYSHGLVMGGPAEMAFGWPLVIAGLTKVVYDLTLLGLYHDVPEQEGARRGQPSPAPSP